MFENQWSSGSTTHCDLPSIKWFIRLLLRLRAIPFKLAVLALDLKFDAVSWFERCLEKLFMKLQNFDFTLLLFLPLSLCISSSLSLFLSSFLSQLDKYIMPFSFSSGKNTEKFHKTQTFTNLISLKDLPNTNENKNWFSMIGMWLLSIRQWFSIFSQKFLSNSWNAQNSSLLHIQEN